MPCDTRTKRGQTLQQRAEEVRQVAERAAQALAQGRIKAVVGPQGAIAFTGLTEGERDGVTDACIYRRLLSTGSRLALQQIAKAEALAGRTVDKQQVAVGAHSHDGGKTWHDHRG